MKKEKVRYLGHKTFSNRKYTLRVDFYDHNMADTTIDLKLRKSGRLHIHQLFCYIPFDECITESMFDYEDCLKMLDLDKVARRWFIRQMHHCTDGLLRQDGSPDMEAAEKKEDRLYHRTRLEAIALDEQQIATLIRICPEAGFDVAFPNVRIQKSFTVLNKEAHNRFFKNNKYIAMPTEIMLELLEELFPDYLETVKRNRDIKNCNVSLNINWENKTKATMCACVQDNNFILYSKHV